MEKILCNVHASLHPTASNMKIQWWSSRPSPTVNNTEPQVGALCIDGKKAGQKWCGNVPWTAPEKDKRNPLSYTQLQPSCLPPVLNPFKAGGKTDKDSEWRRMHRGEMKRKERGERRQAKSQG
ncbi:hypothetical protein F7725_002373 [Dissostichus mawsoni]|uniref:Uncharacterized protein n=1 Tax=Dissostichus mawsoni TaxID=36200 RepID=A0A7J5Y265_DISMA|nr:hypothetical protein F7725_002373 [Dissostichus mawsoni]